MKTESGLQHLQGIEAYQIYWEQYYQCLPRLSTIRAIDLNLEIVVDNTNTLLAFRHDIPDDMQEMVLNSGHWCIWQEEKMGTHVLVELSTFMGRLRRGIC